MPNKTRTKTIKKIMKSNTKKPKPNKPKRGSRTKTNTSKRSGYGKK
mgnify:CR=1 FL=1